MKKNMHWSQGPNVLGIATSKEYCNSGEGYILVFPKNCINIGQNRQFKNFDEHDTWNMSFDKSFPKGTIEINKGISQM